jgi:hypothetical protein
MLTRKTGLLGLIVAASLIVAACGSSGPLTPARHGPPGPFTSPGPTGFTIQLGTAVSVRTALARTSAASAPEPAAAVSRMPAGAAAAWSERLEA